MRVRLGWAAALAVVGVLWFLLEAQSPSFLQWSGDRVPAYSEGGITFYSYGGQDYTVTDPSQPADDRSRQPRTVVVDPSDPSVAQLSSTTRWLDAALVLVWFVAAGWMVLLALRHRRRMARRHAQGAG